MREVFRWLKLIVVLLKTQLIDSGRGKFRASEVSRKAVPPVISHSSVLSRKQAVSQSFVLGVIPPGLSIIALRCVCLFVYIFCGPVFMVTLG